MKCPHCGVYVMTLETRELKSGRVRRRYECANLHRFTTYESHAHEKDIHLGASRSPAPGNGGTGRSP